jgi:hypothetical protein
MDLKNGYKVIYERTEDSKTPAGGKRTFYASKLVNGGIDPETDTVLASLNDADVTGQTLYEYKGKFYISEGALPAYDNDGVPTDKEIEIENYDEVFVEKAVELETPVCAHDFVEEAADKYLKSAATTESAAVYYKSCSKCGESSTDTFTHGEPLQKKDKPGSEPDPVVE